MPRIEEWRASEGEVALRRAELLVLVEETWLDMAESATLLDESYTQLVKTCAQEGKSVPSSVVSARREHLVARRELVATCLASRESAGVDLDLSWLTGDHDCAWIPLPSS
ncbi:hypothetical protein [Candidatus Poriferisodalis sp.]|uniref:hypothetical protein n=1 Tax=Candidatus Poriferisodalis sp. TaxID=3101277 RepID=UPI003B5C2371